MKRDLEEKIISEQTVFKGRIFTVKTADIITAQGQEADRELVCHHGGAAVVPLDKDGNVYLIRQYRIAISALVYEIPAGKLELGEDPFDCAQRELLEETGLQSSNWSKLAITHPSPGYTSEINYLYLARNVEKVAEQDLDEDEAILIEKMSWETIFSKIKAGEITDGKTIIALCLARRELEAQDAV